MEDLILKYLENTLTDAELDSLLAWLEIPENQVVFKRSIQLQYGLDAAHPLSHIEGFANIKRQLLQQRRHKQRKIFLRIAAIFIGLLCLGGVSYYAFLISPTPQQEFVKLKLNDGSVQYIRTDKQLQLNKEEHYTIQHQTIVYNQIKADTTTQQVVYNTLTVPYGKTFSVILSDGTEVQLNAGSSLRFPVQFSSHIAKREVYLEGEGLFKVTHNVQHPFIVHTKNLGIKVLGTHFVVSAYKNEHESYAVLISGSISAKNPHTQDSILVKPGYKVFYHNKNLQTTPVYIEKYTAWTKGELVFIKDPFAVIVHKLERKYNVVIDNHYPALNRLIITARFQKESIEQVMKTFQTYKNFNYTIHGNKITINKPSK